MTTEPLLVATTYYMRWTTYRPPGANSDVDVAERVYRVEGNGQELHIKSFWEPSTRVTRSRSGRLNTIYTNNVMECITPHNSPQRQRKQ